MVNVTNYNLQLQVYANNKASIDPSWAAQNEEICPKDRSFASKQIGGWRYFPEENFSLPAHNAFHLETLITTWSNFDQPTDEKESYHYHHYPTPLDSRHWARENFGALHYSCVWAREQKTINRKLSISLVPGKFGSIMLRWSERFGFLASAPAASN